jgi:hypothetical protein
VPAIPPTNLRPQDDVVQRELQARADIDALRDYALEADALLRGCVTETQLKPKGETK